LLGSFGRLIVSRQRPQTAAAARKSPLAPLFQTELYPEVGPLDTAWHSGALERLDSAVPAAKGLRTGVSGRAPTWYYHRRMPGLPSNLVRCGRTRGVYPHDERSARPFCCNRNPSQRACIPPSVSEVHGSRPCQGYREVLTRSIGSVCSRGLASRHVSVYRHCRHGGLYARCGTEMGK
jgi:hypothetical protein